MIGIIIEENVYNYGRPLKCKTLTLLISDILPISVPRGHWLSISFFFSLLSTALINSVILINTLSNVIVKIPEVGNPVLNRYSLYLQVSLYAYHWLMSMNTEGASPMYKRFKDDDGGTQQQQAETSLHHTTGTCIHHYLRPPRGGLWSLSPPISQTLCPWSNSITNLW